MSKYLLDEVKRFRCDRECEAEQLLAQIKVNNEVVDYSITQKCKKEKGQVVDEWVVLKVKVKVNEEKEPVFTLSEVM